MQNELNQEQIDAMVRAARSGGQAEAAREPRVELWDVRRAGQIRREQLQAITQLHEGFARSLTLSLGAYLRVVFEAALVSAEHLTYHEFLERIPETTYLASCTLDPMGVYGALQIDLKVAFPIIDLLLGGEGKGVAATREITEIEEEILESVARIVCRDLGTAWQAVNLEVGFEKRMEPAEAQRLMLPGDKTLSLSFEITMPEVRGGLNLAVPISASHALLRKISADWADRRARRRSEWRDRLKRQLLDCSFSVELGVSDLRAEVGELSQLAPGQLVPLRRSAARPASLLVAGVEMFRAVPARSGDVRAAQVLARGEEADAAATAEKAKKP
ncbi:MAG: FliM/FliN family flagellar motor switch protein [Candidatus Sulfotelmatobacter sp.]|jgi:flagellar motor switch protein FliM